MNILITGATKGIGRAIAEKMVELGHNVAVCARNAADLSALEEALRSSNSSVQVFAKAVDLSEKEQVYNFADQALDFFGTIEVLVNNAGLFLPSFVLDEADDSLEKQLQLNLLAPYYLYKKLAPSMRNQRKGHIFNICSVSSKEININAGSYGVTKAALLSLNHVMRAEMMACNVKVTAILPGSTFTHSWEGAQIPKDRFIQAEDVAETISGVLSLSNSVNVEEILMKPLHGQIGG